MQDAAIELAGEPERLAAVMEFLQEFWSEAGLAPGSEFPFELSLEELFLNVAIHGAAGAESPPTVQITLRRAGDRVEATMRDNGIPFNPLTLEAPDVTLAIEDREIGGLGVFLVQEMMDEVEYAFVDGRNCMRIAKEISAESAASV